MSMAVLLMTDTSQEIPFPLFAFQYWNGNSFRCYFYLCKKNLTIDDSLKIPSKNAVLCWNSNR